MNISQDTVRKIIEIGVRAPSGDNLQPWRFEVGNSTIRVFHVQKSDSIYDFKRRGSLTGLGALIETIKIAATHFGYSADIKLFPDEDRNHIADIGLLEGGVSEDPLFSFIDRRATDRNRYTGEPLSQEERAAILQIPDSFRGLGEVRMVEDKKEKWKLAKILSNNERLIFGNKALHNNFYIEFRWTREQVEKTKDGLDVRSLGISAMDLTMVKLLQSWPLSNFLSKIGVSSIIAHKTASNHASASAICAILMQDSSEESFVQGGRLLQRVWLQATSLGLHVQPAFGFVLLGERAACNEAQMFLPHQIAVITDSYNKLKQMFGVTNQTFTFMLRVGKGTQTPIRSLRKEPSIIFH